MTTPDLADLAVGASETSSRCVRSRSTLKTLRYQQMRPATGPTTVRYAPLDNPHAESIMGVCESFGTYRTYGIERSTYGGSHRLPERTRGICRVRRARHCRLWPQPALGASVGRATALAGAARARCARRGRRRRQEHGERLDAPA